MVFLPGSSREARLIARSVCRQSQDGFGLLSQLPCVLAFPASWSRGLPAKGWCGQAGLSKHRVGWLAATLTGLGLWEDLERRRSAAARGAEGPEIERPGEKEEGDTSLTKGLSQSKNESL